MPTADLLTRPTDLDDAPPGRRHRPRDVVLLVASLLLAGALTLTPVGEGWSWGAPGDELRWYAAGLDHPGTLVQLVGNVVLLVPAAASAVRVHPRLGRVRTLAAASLGAAVLVEVLQLVLPLGRVVSPLDAVLNATGAVLAGLAARALAARRAGPPVPGATTTSVRVVVGRPTR